MIRQDGTAIADEPAIAYWSHGNRRVNGQRQPMLDAVSLGVVRSGRLLLDGDRQCRYPAGTGHCSARTAPGESTLMTMLGARGFPTRGTVDVLNAGSARSTYAPAHPSGTSIRAGVSTFRCRRTRWCSPA